MQERARTLAFLLRCLLDVVVCGLLLAVISGYSSSLLIRAMGLARDHLLPWLAFEGLVFSLFTMANLWGGLLFFGGWIVFFTPRTRRGWGLLAVASFLAGVLASWVFQAYPVVPYDADSVVNTPAVEMMSPISFISCFATVFSNMLVAWFYSACEEKTLHRTNVLVDGSI